MSEIDYHNRLIGRVIAHLIENGLRRVDIEPAEAFDIMEETHGDEIEAVAEFFDVLNWMKDEGLIRVSSIQAAPVVGDIYNGVQLTSKALNGIKEPQEDLEGKSIQAVVETSSGGLSGDLYGKIGEALGGFVAGFTKGIVGS